MPLRRPLSDSTLAAIAGALTLGLAIATPGSADPEEALAAPSVRQLAPLTRKQRPRPPAWMGENVAFEKGYGLEYKHDLRLGETPLELGFKGPVVRKKKSLGLTVEVRF